MISTDKVFEQLKSFEKSGKLAGSWLVTGPKGTGKAALLKRFIAYLLTGEERQRDFYADLKWISRSLTEEEKKNVAQALSSGRELDVSMEDRAKKSEITIDDIRDGISFLSLTSANENWRVLVIDTADDMNENAANALLKLLEEPPPHSVIFLISNNLGKLLPTIRSRCRQITLQPLSNVQMKTFIMENYPEANVDSLLPFFEGSIGKTKEFFENDGVNLYAQVLQLIENPSNIEDIFALADKVAKNEQMYALLKDLLLFCILQQVKNQNTPETKRNALIKFWDEINKLFYDTQNLYLDKKSVIIEILLKAGKIK